MESGCADQKIDHLRKVGKPQIGPSQSHHLMAFQQLLKVHNAKHVDQKAFDCRVSHAGGMQCSGRSPRNSRAARPPPGTTDRSAAGPAPSAPPSRSRCRAGSSVRAPSRSSGPRARSAALSLLGPRRASMGRIGGWLAGRRAGGAPCTPHLASTPCRARGGRQQLRVGR